MGVSGHKKRKDKKDKEIIGRLRDQRHGWGRSARKRKKIKRDERIERTWVRKSGQ